MRRFSKKLRADVLRAAIMALSIPCRAQSADVLDIGRSVDAIFQDWNKPNEPGCVVGIQQEGSQPLVRGYGSADLEHDVAINPSTVFEAGSVSKQFTAASILMLAEDGKLALAHDGGEVEALAGWPRTSRVYTLTDVLDIAARQKSLNYPPGTAYSYTNTGFNLLAIIVERVSKKTLAQFSQERLFEPLGMIHTQWRDDFRRVVQDRAVAYEAGKDGYRQQMPFEDAYGNGGLLTTVADLLRWNDALTAGELGNFVTTELQRQATLDTGHLIAYSRGLFTESYHGVREIAHPGATAGYRAWLGRYPEQHLSIAVLCNASNINPVTLAHKVADLFLPAQAPAPRPIVRLTAEQAARRAGLYVDLRMGLPLRLEVQDDALRVFGGPVLVAQAPDELRAGTTTFRFSGNNLLTRETADGDVLEYRRTQPWQPISSELLRLAGNYKSDEAMATYHVTVKDDRLAIAPEDRRGEELILHPIFADTFEFSDNSVTGVLHFSRDSKGRVSGFEMSDPRVHALAFRRIAGNSQSH
jgi:CubicO group peptidase (beta-lactamase class C family)